MRTTRSQLTRLAPDAPRVFLEHLEEYDEMTGNWNPTSIRVILESDSYGIGDVSDPDVRHWLTGIVQAFTGENPQ